MRAVISRLISPLIATLAVWLVGVGFLREDDAATFISSGVTLVELLIWGMVYGVGHRLIDRRANPADAATPEAAAAVRAVRRP